MSELLTKSEVLDALSNANCETLDDIADQLASKSKGKVKKKDILWTLQTWGITSLDDIAEKVVAAVQKRDQSQVERTFRGPCHIDI